MKNLKIAEDLKLPLDAITQTFLVVGKRGSGKSNTAARMVEQFHHAKLPFVVLDPVDTWWGLKAGRDGGPGLDVYVFGGKKQDLQLEAGAGALIAEVLCEHRISMVLSVKHLSGRERSGFMVAFAQTLFQKWAGGPLHVVLEEAHELAPQMAGGRGANTGDNEAAMLGAFKRLWKLGRSQGIGGTAVTQRPASLSKDITTQSEILVAHRTIGPQDVAAIGQWVKYHGQHEEILGELPSMPTGEAYIWAPEFPEGQPLGLKRVTVLRRDTFDSASTPKVGETRVEPKELAPVDMERLRTKMAATIEKAKADDPRELRRRIGELEKQLKTSSVPAPNLKESTQKTVEKAVLTDADRALLANLVGVLKARHPQDPDSGAVLGGFIRLEAKVTHDLSELLQRFRGSIDTEWKKRLERVELMFESKGLANILEKIERVSVTPVARPLQAPSPRVNAVRTPPKAASPRLQAASHAHSNGHVSDGLTPAKQKILNALAFLSGIGVAPADKTQLALIVGVSPTSGGYFNNLGSLRSSGLIEYPQGGTVALTESGQAIASTEGIPSTTDELHDAIRAKVPPAKWKILEALIENYPDSMTKDALAEKIDVSPTSGGYFNNLGSLRSLGLIDYPRPSEVAALPVLFLEGG